jgi:hypothetical protein
MTIRNQLNPLTDHVEGLGFFVFGEGVFHHIGHRFFQGEFDLVEVFPTKTGVPGSLPNKGLDETQVGQVTRAGELQGVSGMAHEVIPFVQSKWMARREKSSSRMSWPW